MPSRCHCSRHRSWDRALGGAEPNLLGTVAEHYAKRRTPCGCGRVQGRERQGRATKPQSRERYSSLIHPFHWSYGRIGTAFHLIVFCGLRARHCVIPIITVLLMDTLTPAYEGRGGKRRP